jgi:hypothetical protein
MNWRASPKRRVATNEEGYRITWADHPSKELWYNAYTPGTKASPDGRCIGAGLGKTGLAACKEACEKHLAARTANT